MNNSILLITPSPAEIITVLNPLIKEYNIKIDVAKSGIEGIEKCITCHPALLLVDSELPDLKGESLSAILKDTQKGCNYTIYIFNIDKFLQNTKADYYFPALNKNFKECLCMQLKVFFDKKLLKEKHSEEIERAKIEQASIIPKKIETNTFQVNNVYSPFSELSGDGLDYWTGEDEHGLYGLLFDCTGHDIVSFLQVGEIRALLKKGCKYYQSKVYKSLSEIMQNVNTDLFGLHGEDTICTAAIIFYFDFKENILHYCSAGIPSFYVKYQNTAAIKKIECRNYLIGYTPDATFKAQTLPLNNVDEVIFSSDGFSELFMNQENIDLAKHDDVSAILITLKRDN